MKQVYVLICWADYENEKVCGVYPSLEEAQKGLTKANPWSKSKINDAKWCSNCRHYEIHQCDSFLTVS